MNQTTLIIIIGIMIAAGTIILILIPEAKGSVFLHEDQALICLSAVWTITSNDIVCKVFNLDDIRNTHQVYSEIMQEQDTFLLGDLK
jgi:hypothetical protein